MIPIRCKAVSGVALTTVDGETRLLVMKRVKGGFWCHVAGTVEVVPVFVVYCPPNQAVTLNDEHTEYRWCSLAEAKALVSFPGQKALYDHIWHHFVDNAPSPLMRVDIC